MTSMDDAFVARGLIAWRADSKRPPRPAAIASARAAMLSAVAAQPRRRLAVLLGLRRRPQGTAVRLALVGVATGAALTIGAIGWNSPAGSPLHAVRLARERVELAVPGIDSVTLKVGFAEDRLADAESGRDPVESLAEATSLLAAVEGSLPADHTAAVWTRWNADEAELAVLEAEESPNPSRSSASTSPSSAGGGGLAPAGASHASPRPTGREGEPSENGGAGSEPPEPSERAPSTPGQSPEPSEREGPPLGVPSPTPSGVDH